MSYEYLFDHFADPYKFYFGLNYPVLTFAVGSFLNLPMLFLVFSFEGALCTVLQTNKRLIPKLF